MRARSLLYTLILICSACITGCGDAENGNQKNIDQQNSENNKEEEKKSFVYTKYELPLSVDVYKFLKTKNIPFRKELVHSLDVKDKYFTEVERALVLGVYTSDLAYATIYEKSQEAVDYFAVAIDLAYKLNIDEGYEKESLDKAYDNIDNNDTLSYIASQAYLKTCKVLEGNKSENILPYVVLASWVESLYILCKSAESSSPEDGVFNEICNHKKHLNSLLKYLNDIISEENLTSMDEMKDIITELEALKNDFNKINLEETISCKKEDVESITERVITLRNKFL